MSDKPILFSAPMVRALLDGRKTQTRRVLTIPKGFDVVDLGESEPERASLAITDPHRWGSPYAEDGAPMDLTALPRIACGDRLWVKETWTAKMVDGWTIGDARSGRYQTQLVYRADGADSIDGWWPAIHMPREFSRITLTVTDVRVERLQDISEGDALAEGIDRLHYPERGDWGWPQRKYREVWEAINGPGSWDANPWVAAYTFTVQLGNIDQLAEAA